MPDCYGYFPVTLTHGVLEFHKHLIVNGKISQVVLFFKFVAKSLHVAKGIFQGSLYKLHVVLLYRRVQCHGSIGGRFTNHLFPHPTFLRDEDYDIAHDLCLTGQTVAFFLLLQIEEFSFRWPHGGKIVPC